MRNPKFFDRICPNCSKDLDPTATSCLSCKQDLQKHPGYWYLKQPILVTGLFIVIIGLFMGLNWFIYSLSLPPSTSQPRQLAYYDCKNYVAVRLMLSDSAEFPRYNRRSVRRFQNGEYVVESYFDSDDGSGAVVRKNYYCHVQRPRGLTIRYFGDNKPYYELIELIIE